MVCAWSDKCRQLGTKIEEFAYYVQVLGYREKVFQRLRANYFHLTHATNMLSPFEVRNANEMNQKNTIVSADDIGGTKATIPVYKARRRRQKERVQERAG